MVAALLLDAVRRWVELAEHDLINAHHTLLLGRERPYDHAPQCAEKYLKLARGRCYTPVRTANGGGMSQSVRFTSADLESFPDDGKRYEIIDGELYVSKQPSWQHQMMCVGILVPLELWSRATGAGFANIAPGIIFAEDDDVAPDLVWVSADRLATVLSADGKLHAAPDLIVEVLSPGPANARRDRDAKLKLYGRRGVREYWIVDWQNRQVEVYRRADATLRLAATLLAAESLDSPLLPGFALPLGDLFARVS